MDYRKFLAGLSIFFFTIDVILFDYCISRQEECSHVNVTVSLSNVISDKQAISNNIYLFARSSNDNDGNSNSNNNTVHYQNTCNTAKFVISWVIIFVIVMAECLIVIVGA